MVILTKIVKYKKGSKGKYKVILDDGRELSFYEEVILKYQLLIKKEIDEDTMIEADQYNQECDVYYVALHSIENRFKSVYELRLWLKKREYPDEYIQKAIDTLQRQGYLNDQLYARSYINTQMLTTHNGPYKIMRELQEKKVDSDIIEEEIKVFTEEEEESRVQKLIEKEIKRNHTKGGIVLKQKIYNNLKLLGYDISVLNKVMERFSFGNDQEIAKKEYEKLYRKYSRKYEGEDLKRKIQEKMYLKGLKYEEES